MESHLDLGADVCIDNGTIMIDFKSSGLSYVSSVIYSSNFCDLVELSVGTMISATVLCNGIFVSVRVYNDNPEFDQLSSAIDLPNAGSICYADYIRDQSEQIVNCVKDIAENILSRGVIEIVSMVHKDGIGCGKSERSREIMALLENR